MERTTIKAPVVLAEREDVEVLIDGRELIEPSALKITDIQADIRNLQLDVVVLDLPEVWDQEDPPRFRVKVIVQGVLHKQIFWVGKRDNMIHHMAVDHPFSTFVLFTEDDVQDFGEDFNKSSIPTGFEFDERKIQAQVWNAEVEAIVSNLISPNRLQERVLLGFTIKLEQLAQVALAGQNKKHR